VLPALVPIRRCLEPGPLAVQQPSGPAPHLERAFDPLVCLPGAQQGVVHQGAYPAARGSAPGRFPLLVAIVHEADVVSVSWVPTGAALGTGRHENGPWTSGVPLPDR